MTPTVDNHGTARDLTSYSGAVCLRPVAQRIAVDHSYQSDEAYSYKLNGNRTTSGYQTGPNNRLLNDGTYSYSYDNEGNRSRRTHNTTGEVIDYTWDRRDRLTSVESAPVSREL